MYSQYNQDDWVLLKFPISNGFFLDVGCSSGINFSNTLKLEERGWTGIAIDPFPTGFEKRKNTVVEKCVVYSKSDVDVEFVNAGMLSGIVNHIDKNRVKLQDRKTTWFKTTTLESILDKHSVPNYIHYLSMDTEGSEYEILSTFNFDKYKFGCISIEHNYIQDNRKNIRCLLEKNGYEFEKVNRCDDFYVSRI